MLRRAACWLLLLSLLGAASRAAGAETVPLLPERRPLLTAGSRGPEVAALQRALQWLGLEVGGVDGRFGPRTRTAVLAFQRRHGLEPDGRVGPATWSRLSAELARAVTVYEVRRGDTLSAIARRHGVSPAQLVRDNGLADPDRLHPGQRLIIRRPPAEGGGPATGAAPAAAGGEGHPARADGAVAAGGAGGATDQPADRVSSGADGQRGSPGAAATGGARAAGAGGPVALTFNDGPDVTVTPALLDTLARFRVRATFFVVGARAEREPELVRRMAREGHEVESHGYEHRPPAGRPVAEIRADLARSAGVIQRLTGRRPLFFRPPGGQLDPAVVAAAADQGLRIVMWTNVGAEHRPDLPREEMAARLLRAAYPGAVLMLHADLPGTAELVELLLLRARGLGISFVPLGELLRSAEARDD